MNFKTKTIRIALEKPKIIIAFILAVCLILGSLIVKVHIDTDPENMLNDDEAVRVFHNLTKKDFNLHDVVVLGVVNEEDPNGVFNPSTLKNIHDLSEFAAGLKDANDSSKYVVAKNIISPGNVEVIEQEGLGQVRFDWLMKTPPKTVEGALAVKDKIMDSSLLKGTLASEDGKAMGIYIPITAKDFAHQVREELLAKIATLPKGDDKFYITGLPVAEDTFGKEMFVQMAVSAPLAMVVIFLLMLLFFKKVKLIIAPMIVAMITVISTMGLLIGTGHTLHIMSSMIPIFLMPIAVVDSIHILSEFFDQYQRIKDRRATIEHVIGHLFMPMFYTSLTSAAGFASLALTPIPPVQAFGIFVAIGIMFAWLLTIFFVPAYIMLMSEASLADFGASHGAESKVAKNWLDRKLSLIGMLTSKYAKLIIVANLLLLGVAGYGISKIVINDNPVKWFKESHDIRVADKVLNHHFGGTYEAYLVFGNDQGDLGLSESVSYLESRIAESLKDNDKVRQEAVSTLRELGRGQMTVAQLVLQLADQWQTLMEAVPVDNDRDYEAWGSAIDQLESLKNRDQIFKRPDMLAYIEKLQEFLVKEGRVGKSNSITDVVKKVHTELYEGNPEYYSIPASVAGVAQCLISFQNSHKPDDLWHLVTPDYRKANIWMQLKTGDNTDMQEVVVEVDRFVKENPPPVAITYDWAGLTYINVVWQDKMVSGMRDSFLGSFVIVFLMMTILFRSPSWGLLAMVPLTFTIAFIYGVVGLIGKDYDMPVAVLSSLTLGLAVDFAIHFLERYRSTYRKTGSIKETVEIMFEEPARAITRNTIVIAVGFTPLLAAPLIPYQTVGVLLGIIMLYSGLATMWILPSMLIALQGWFFRNEKKQEN